MLRFTFDTFEQLVSLSPYVEIVNNNVVGQGLVDTYEEMAYGNRYNVYIMDFSIGKFVCWERGIEEWRMRLKTEEEYESHESFGFKAFGRWQGTDRGILYGDVAHGFDFVSNDVVGKSYKNLKLNSITLIVPDPTTERPLPFETNCHVVADDRKISSTIECPLGEHWDCTSEVDKLRWVSAIDNQIPVSSETVMKYKFLLMETSDEVDSDDERELAIVKPTTPFEFSADGDETVIEAEAECVLDDDDVGIQLGKVTFHYKEGKIDGEIHTDEDDLYLYNVHIWKMAPSAEVPIIGKVPLE